QQANSSQHDGRSESEEDYNTPRTPLRTKVACQFCRARKIKCDGRPICANCQRRGIACNYVPV
ncbi:hypothetical protein POSPLADRAFT_1158789, partial [Postia placenta MAD-698-R-SB12]